MRLGSWRGQIHTEKEKRRKSKKILWKYLSKPGLGVICPIGSGWGEALRREPSMSQPGEDDSDGDGSGEENLPRAA